MGRLPADKRPDKPIPVEAIESGIAKVDSLAIGVEDVVAEQVQREIVPTTRKPETVRVIPKVPDARVSSLGETVALKIVVPQATHVMGDSIHNLLDQDSERRPDNRVQTSLVELETFKPGQLAVIPEVTGTTTVDERELLTEYDVRIPDYVDEMFSAVDLARQAFFESEITEAKVGDGVIHEVFEPANIEEKIGQYLESVDLAQAEATEDVIEALNVIDELITSELETQLPASLDSAEEPIVIDDLGAPYTAENSGLVDPDPKEVEGYRPDISAHVEDDQLDDESSVDVLLAGLEEGMLSVEEEYVGELLVGLFVDPVEVDVSSEPEKAIDAQSPIVAVVEKNQEAVTDSPGVVTLQDLQEEFGQYLEFLDSGQAELVEDIVEVPNFTINMDKQLSVESNDKKVQLIEQELEDLCTQLFESLGIEYDSETTKQFIQNIKLLEYFITDKSEVFNIKDLIGVGTREYKPLDYASLLKRFVQFVRQKTQPYIVLGRYTMQVCSA